eukprot:CAMPEP_0196755184 /NCGR_PEP_ID=MMETSP1091-20130531/96504_1 /TAXON_ID=302021 /ORGANISM="Rhodomonas sp., Strain CCMP768" /LENGTH=55 /DNA_ID=CAMNT_0042103557 /DNA_START=53 /DNA_END=217 /DNA_ORIENTATION=-
MKCVVDVNLLVPPMLLQFFVQSRACPTTHGRPDQHRAEAQCFFDRRFAHSEVIDK